MKCYDDAEAEAEDEGEGEGEGEDHDHEEEVEEEAPNCEPICTTEEFDCLAMECLGCDTDYEDESETYDCSEEC